MDSVDDAATALSAADPQQRREGARTLFVRARGDPGPTSEHADALEAALDDEDPAVRGHALAALSWLGRLPDGDLRTPVAPPSRALADALVDPDDRVRQTAVGLVSEPDQTFPEDLRPTAAAGLVGCLADDNDLVRLRSAETLSASAVVANPDTDGAVGALFEALADDRADVRTNAGETIATLAVDHSDRLDGYGDRLASLRAEGPPAARASAGFALAVLRQDEESVRMGVEAVCDALPIEDRWAGTYWMRTLLQSLAGEAPGPVATAIENHDDPPADFQRLARRIRGRRG